MSVGGPSQRIMEECGKVVNHLKIVWGRGYAEAKGDGI